MIQPKCLDRLMMLLSSNLSCIIILGTLSAVLQLARLKETFGTTVCVLYRKPFSLLELGYLIIINLLRSVDHPYQNTVYDCITCLAYICMSIYFCTECCRDICSRRAMLLWHRNYASWIVVHCFGMNNRRTPFFTSRLRSSSDGQISRCWHLAYVYEFWAGQLELKTRWNADCNANEYVPTAHKYIKVTKHLNDNFLSYHSNIILYIIPRSSERRLV